MKARDLWRQIAASAWECADPGLQFDTTINKWHTAPNTGRINGVNPCSEYMHLDNSACNLASINLMHVPQDDGSFDVDGFKHTDRGHLHRPGDPRRQRRLPDREDRRDTRQFRQLGLGYANLGALLMASGLPYDSDEGRAWAAAITALMTGHAYATSARAPRPHGSVRRVTRRTQEPMLDVLRMHRDAAYRDRRGPGPGRARSTRPSIRGTKPSTSARATACATPRPRCWRRPAPSAS